MVLINASFFLYGVMSVMQLCGNFKGVGNMQNVGIGTIGSNSVKRFQRKPRVYVDAAY